MARNRPRAAVNINGYHHFKLGYDGISKVIVTNINAMAMTSSHIK